MPPKGECKKREESNEYLLIIIVCKVTNYISIPYTILKTTFRHNPQCG